MLTEASPDIGQPRDFRTHAKQPATRNCVPFSAPGTVADLGAIPAGHRRADASLWCGAVLHNIARVGQPLGNDHPGVSGTITAHLRRTAYGALPGSATRRHPY